MRADRTALCAWLACCAAALSAHKYSTRVVRTKYGPLRGIVVHAHPQVEAYLGVPYATPPLGSLRYMPPVTPSMWRSPRLADAPGAACPQAPPPAASAPRADALLQYPRARLRQLDRLLPLLANQSEDCLYVNLYVPVTGEPRNSLHSPTTTLRQALELVPERTEVTFFDPKYIVFVNASTHRTGRRGAVVTDLHGFIRHPWGNNITAQIVMYEYLSNEYKRSFIQMSVKLCDLMKKDKFIAPLIQQTVMGNLTCPYRAGEWNLFNMTVKASNVPPNFPLKKGRINLDLMLTANRQTLASGVTYIELKDMGKKKGKTKLFIWKLQ